MVYRSSDCAGVCWLDFAALTGQLLFQLRQRQAFPLLNGLARSPMRFGAADACGYGPPKECGFRPARRKSRTRVGHRESTLAFLLALAQMQILQNTIASFKEPLPE
jgi:hypothetical protein